jgi:transposase
MSAAYWAAVTENLPDAAVVFDRFHIVKLVNEKLDMDKAVRGFGKELHWRSGIHFQCQSVTMTPHRDNGIG